MFKKLFGLIQNTKDPITGTENTELDVKVIEKFLELDDLCLHLGLGDVLCKGFSTGLSATLYAQQSSTISSLRLVIFDGCKVIDRFVITNNKQNYKGKRRLLQLFDKKDQKIQELKRNMQAKINKEREQILKELGLI